MILTAWHKVEVLVPPRPDSQSAGEWYDITDNLENGLVLEETADLLDKLEFRLVGTPEVSVMRFVDEFIEGMKIRACFGYMNGMKALNQEDEMFIGFIDRLITDFGKNGVVSLDAICYDPAWLMTKKEPTSQLTFPNGLGKKSMTPEEVIKLVVGRYAPDFRVGRVELPEKHKGFVFDAKHPIVQKENDWKFLKRLAHGDEDAQGWNLVKKHDIYRGLDCIVYVDYQDGESRLNFVPADERLSDVSPLKLVYPLYNQDIPIVNDPTATEGTQIIENARVDDDRDQGEPVMVNVPGDAFAGVLSENEVKSINDEGGAKVSMADFFQSFEIDYDKIDRDEKAGRIKWGFTDFVAGSIKYDDVRSYVKLKLVYAPGPQKDLPSDVPVSREEMKDPERRRQFIEKKLGLKKKKRKNAGFSMRVTLAAGNTSVRPRRVYWLEGLGGKYSSSETQRWFADSVTHSVTTLYKQVLRFTQ